jgi:hypothetical protein
LKRTQTETVNLEASDEALEADAPQQTMKEKSKDINEFFEPPENGPDGSKSKRCCKLCRYAEIYYLYFVYLNMISGSKNRSMLCTFVMDTTTLRRHIEYKHKVSLMFSSLSLMTYC